MTTKKDPKQIADMPANVRATLKVRRRSTAAAAHCAQSSPDSIQPWVLHFIDTTSEPSNQTVATDAIPACHPRSRAAQPKAKSSAVNSSVNSSEACELASMRPPVSFPSNDSIRRRQMQTKTPRAVIENPKA